MGREAGFASISSSLSKVSRPKAGSGRTATSTAPLVAIAAKDAELPLDLFRAGAAVGLEFE